MMGAARKPAPVRRARKSEARRGEAARSGKGARSARRRPRPRKRKGFFRSRGGQHLMLALVIAGIVAFVVSRIDVGGAIREVTLPLRHDDIIRQQAAEKDLDPALIAAVIYHESKFHDQTSVAGARGLMQITPDTAQQIEKSSGGSTFETDDLADPEINISYGSFYLRELLDKYGGNEVAALAAYNAGPGNADAWGGSGMKRSDIQFPETRAYVDGVLETRNDYRNNYASELGIG